ncbi:MAG: D-alanyl-D-alanine carboxypeptidase [Oscillospiraceae bacterium]|nr:D-alanyl-D-alanine carboxypeptidase [Oscillospiraceae bacterium]MCI9547819.1 D-alanyl-D-alanine carboxypeptidase [Oscillospiraceae bacterium]
MKKAVAALALLAVCVLACPPVRAVGTHASCAILMDAESGRVLFEQDIHRPRLIASITKLLTALVAVEQAEDLDEMVSVKGEWLGSEGSSIYLKAGEEISLRGLLYGLLLQSGNDAAMAIACHTAGSEADFVARMNEKAAQLGMDDSSFANPSGLNDDEHYSTAYDMALLARACLENETVAEICATRSITIGTRTFVNHNKLLYRYEGCVGMKTGFTEKAGRTLVSAATRDGQTLICVTLNDGDDWNDHCKLLDYGFQTYPRRVLCRAGEVLGSVAVGGSLIPTMAAVTQGELGHPFAQGEEPEMEIELLRCPSAPIDPQVQLGEARWLLDGRVIARMPLMSQGSAELDAREPLDLWQKLWAGLSGPARR